MSLTSFNEIFTNRNYQKAKSVLIVSTDAVGDCLMLTALVFDMKSKFPHLDIYIQSNPISSLIFKNHPSILSIVNSSNYQQYDITVNYNNIIAKLPEYFNGIGFMDILGNIAGIKFEKRDIIYSQDKEEIEFVKNVLPNKFDKNIVGIHLNTSKDIKRSYPYLKELIEAIINKDKNTAFINFGTERYNGRSDIQVLEASIHFPDLRKQIALASLCDGFITIDSSFFHVGHNLYKKPTLGVFGLTNPYLVGNHSNSFSVIVNDNLNCLNCYWQKKCDIECMNQLSPELIAEAYFNIDEYKITPEFDNIEIEISKSTNIDELLFNFYATNRRAIKAVLIDKGSNLPDYSKYWNGITIINTKENTVQDYFNTGNTGLGYSQVNSPSSVEKEQPTIILNLGCGEDVISGFINIDKYLVQDDIVNMDALELEYPDNSVKMILAADLLQCFSYLELSDVLEEWHRVLIPEGELVLSVPSVTNIIRLINNGKLNAESASRLLFGNQERIGDFYSSCFDKEFITSLLENAGFNIITYEEASAFGDENDINIVIRCKKKVVAQTAKIFESPQPAPEKVVESTYNPVLNFGNQLPKITFNFDNDEEESSSPVGVSNEPQFIAPPQSDADRADEIRRTISNIISGNENKVNEPLVVEQKPFTPIQSGMDKVNIVWEGSQFVYHSLALINREICYNIIKSGAADVTIIPYEKEQFLPDGNEKFELLYKNDIRNKPLNTLGTENTKFAWVRHTWPPKAEPPKGARWFIIQPWEFSTHRTDFVEIFKQTDEIWTPSIYSRNTYLNSGLEYNKVQVVPNGVDPTIWSPNGKRLELNTNKKLKFLFVGGTIYRKGIDILLQSYISTFTSEDNVCLVIKDMGGDSFYKGQTAKDKIEEIQRNPKAPEIHYIDDYITEEQLVGLYKACDVFISPYRGEGFSLPTLEAMACGLPVVVTKGGSTDDFTDESYCWYIPASKKSVGKILDKQPLTGEAFLLEPDETKLSEILRNIYAEPSSIFSKGLIAQYNARTKWTWRKATIKVLSRLDMAYNTNMATTAERNLPEYTDDAISLGEAELYILKGDLDRADEIISGLLNSTELSERYQKHAILRKIELCINKQDINTAFDYLQSFIDKYGETTDTTYLHANLQMIQGNISHALELASELLDDWRNNKYDTTLGLNLEELLLFTADNLFNDNDTDGALKLYLEVQKINSSNVNALFGAGMCYHNINAMPEAIRFFEWAVKIDPEFESAWEMLRKVN